ncbi:o-spanin [Xylella phage Paz]|uniref:O-spanin n=1 Tax=Xylella phage Paz TaxID=1415145 RepID=V5Q7M7_9CAUD|nr:o-spanin [Xylella phage Paz]AHB12147.1 o-spanin [Xylella phage Paz]
MRKQNKTVLCIKSGLISLFLMTLLTSCASIEFPKAWLDDCAVTYPADGPMTQWDLYLLAQDRKLDVDRCNVDKAALRAFVESHPKLSIKK